jgi:hypothetical protein
MPRTRLKKSSVFNLTGAIAQGSFRAAHRQYTVTHVTKIVCTSVSIRTVNCGSPEPLGLNLNPSFKGFATSRVIARR